MSMRSLAVLGLVVACDERVCRFDDFVDDHASAETIDCGDIASSSVPDEARFAAPRACVVMANAEQRPFVVRWDLQGVKGTIRRAHVGRLIDGRFGKVWEVSSFTRGMTAAAD